MEDKKNAELLRETSIGTATPPANIDQVRDNVVKAEIAKHAHGDPHGYEALKAVFLEVLGTNNISVEKQTAYKARVGM
jgi:hypothetical protein